MSSSNPNNTSTAATDAAVDRHRLNNLDQRVMQAINEYKERMRQGNEIFVSQRITEIHRMRDTELGKLNLMARFIHNDFRWPLSHTSPQTHLLRQANLPNDFNRLSESVVSLDEVRTLPVPCMEGVLPKSLTSPRAVDIVLKVLEEVAREKSDRAITEGLSMSVPDDVRCLLEITDGVKDPDFRDEGMCQWALWDAYMVEGQLDLSTLEDTARSHFESILIGDLQDLSPMIHGFLQVAVGFDTRDFYKPAYDDNWSSYYLFCRDIRFPNTDRNSGWAWRIVFCRTRNDPPWPGVPVPVCENVFELLTWYTAWMYSPHLPQMVQMVYD